MAATQRYVKPAFTLSTAAEGSWSLVAAVASSGGGCTFFAVVLSITNKVWCNKKKERRRRENSVGEFAPSRHPFLSSQQQLRPIWPAFQLVTACFYVQKKPT
jgi:hypothetical protein